MLRKRHLQRLRKNRPGSIGQRAILRVKFCASVVSQIIIALVAQWIEHPPPKGRVTRSIRVEGANGLQMTDKTLADLKKRFGNKVRLSPADIAEVK